MHIGIFRDSLVYTILRLDDIKVDAVSGVYRVFLQNPDIVLMAVYRKAVIGIAEIENYALPAVIRLEKYFFDLYSLGKL